MKKRTERDVMRHECAHVLMSLAVGGTAVEMVVGTKTCDCKDCQGETSIYGRTVSICMEPRQVAICAAGHASEEAKRGGTVTVKEAGSRHDLHAALGPMEEWPDAVLEPLRVAMAHPKVALALDLMAEVAVATTPDKRLLSAAQVAVDHREVLPALKAAADALSKWEEASQTTAGWRARKKGWLWRVVAQSALHDMTDDEAAAVRRMSCAAAMSVRRDYFGGDDPATIMVGLYALFLAQVLAIEEASEASPELATLLEAVREDVNAKVVPLIVADIQTRMKERKELKS